MEDPIDLSIGQPDLDVPQEIKQAAIESIKSGFNSYAPTAGIPELRKAVTNKLMIKNNINLPSDQVIITSGTSGGIFLAYLSLLNPGDEIVIFDPYFVVYKQHDYCPGKRWEDEEEHKEDWMDGLLTETESVEKAA